VALRLARADEAAYRLAEVALAWSRGPDDGGALSIWQVERTPGFYDVEVEAIRPVPPIAAMLFSEAIHHLRSAVDNVVFHLAGLEGSLSPAQERSVTMLVYDQPDAYEAKVKRLVRQGLTQFGDDQPLGKRIASLQPFNDEVRLPSISPRLAALMGVSVSHAHPLGLLRDYSNEDKHRAIRLAAAGLLVQRHDDWKRSVGRGMRKIEVGTVLEVVKKGEFTQIELSPALHVLRPDETWVGFGPELDGIARHVSDVVIPTLVKGMALPGALPVDIDLGDTGQTILQRADEAGAARAHERVQPVMMKAYADAERKGWRIPATDDAADPF